MTAKPIVLMSRSERYSISDEQEVSVDLVGARRRGWFSALYLAIARYSLRFRLQVDDAKALRRAAQIWSSDPQLANFASNDATSLSVDGVLRALTRFEELLRDLPPSTAYKTSASFRKFFFKHVRALGAAHITTLGVGFKTRLPTKSKPRKLLSDVDGILPPLGATPHRDIKELHGKAYDRLTSDLEKIRAAGARDLEAGDRVRAYLGRCLGREIDLDFLEAVHRATRNKGNKGSLPKFEHIIVEDYIAALLIVFAANGWDGRRAARGISIAYGVEVNAHIKTQARCVTQNPRLIEALNFATAEEIHSAILLLQVHTGWNIKSLLDLQSSDVKKTNGGYEIQSAKTKTDDLTPVTVLTDTAAPAESVREHCTVVDEDVDTVRALQLLMWNHNQAVECGEKERADERLFYWVRARRDDGRPILQHVLDAFCERHALPHFSHEQIRTQVLNIRNFRGLEHAKLGAGHLSISTTGRYLDQEIWRRLNGSINLEFQRRLDDELQWQIGRGANKPYTRLLMPLGDGASCADVHNPPNNDLDDDGMCIGTSCHADGGCRNRRLVINEKRMREIALQEVVYQENWEDLLSQNRHLFLIFHVPAIAFNRALVRLCEEGPYAHVFAKIRSEVAA